MRAAIRLLPVLALLSGVAHPSAALTPPGPPDWLDVSRLPASESGITPDALQLPAERSSLHEREGHGAVELLRRTELRLLENGTLEERTKLVRLYLSDEGIQQRGNVQIAVRTAVETLTVEAAFVLVGSETHTVPPETLQLVANPNPDIYSDTTHVVIALPGLARHAIAAIEYTLRSRTDEWPLPWSRIWVPRSDIPIERFEVIAEWDERRSPPVWKTDDRRVICTTSEPRQVRCSSYQIPALKTDPDVASWFDLVPSLVIGKGHSWIGLVRDELAAMSSSLTGSPELDALAERFVTSSNDPVERLRTLYRFVSDEIRYVAFEHGVDAVVPDHAAETLRNRYGDCKDKVVLFLALASRMGFDAYPVLVASQRYDLARLSIPSWRWFDHMIACVDDVAATRWCVELTTMSAPLGELPSSLQGAVALPLRWEKTQPMRLDARPYDWAIQAHLTNDVDCQGGVLQEARLSFDGPGVIGLRSGLRPLVHRDRLTWAEGSYESIFGKHDSTEVELSGVDAVAGPLIVVARRRLGPYSDIASWDSVHEPDRLLVHYGGMFSTRNKHHPYSLAGLLLNSEVSHRFCGDLAVGHTGAVLRFETEHGSLGRVYEKGANSVIAKSILDLPRRRLGLDELGRFNRFLSRSIDQSAIWFQLGSAR